MIWTSNRYCATCQEWMESDPCEACDGDTHPQLIDDDREEAYERAAARARLNDFADTDGKDWT